MGGYGSFLRTLPAGGAVQDGQLAVQLLHLGIHAVDAADEGGGQQVLGRAAAHQPAVLQRIEPVAVGRSQVQVVQCRQDRPAQAAPQSVPTNPYGQQSSPYGQPNNGAYQQPGYTQNPYNPYYTPVAPAPAPAPNNNVRPPVQEAAYEQPVPEPDMPDPDYDAEEEDHDNKLPPFIRRMLGKK